MLDGDGGRRGAIRLSARGRPIGRLERIELDSVDRPLAFPAVDRALDYVAQLADIAGPAIFDQRVGRLGADTGPVRPTDLRGPAAPEMTGEHHHVALARAQRRQRDYLDRQTIQQHPPA